MSNSVRRLAVVVPILAALCATSTTPAQAGQERSPILHAELWEYVGPPPREYPSDRPGFHGFCSDIGGSRSLEYRVISRTLTHGASTVGVEGWHCISPVIEKLLARQWIFPEEFHTVQSLARTLESRQEADTPEAVESLLAKAGMLGGMMAYFLRSGNEDGPPEWATEIDLFWFPVRLRVVLE